MKQLKYNGTPCNAKISNMVIDLRATRHYTKLANTEMEPKFVGTPVDLWFEQCLPGLDLLQKELGTVSTFANVSTEETKKAKWYAPLVYNILFVRRAA